MEDATATSVLEQAPSTGAQTEANEKPSANKGCEHQEGGRGHSSNNVPRPKHNRISTAPVMTFRQGTLLKEARDKGEPLTEIEKAGLEQFLIWLDLYVPVTEAVVEFHNGGKGKQCFDIFQEVAANFFPFTFTSYLSHLVEKNFESSLGWFRIGFLKEAFAAAGIFDLSSHAFRTDALYGPNSLQSFIKFVGSRPEVFIMLFNMEINQNLNEDPVSQLVSLLNLVGLRQIQVKPDKSDGEVWYKLDETIHDLLMTMTRAGSSGPPDSWDEPREEWGDVEPVDWEAAMKKWIPE